MADSPLQTSLGFAFKMDEASGSRSSSYASATATEAGGTIGDLMELPTPGSFEGAFYDPPRDYGAH